MGNGTEVMTLATSQVDPTAAIFAPAKVAALRTSLPMVTEEDKALVLRLAGDDGSKIADFIGKEITITDVLVHPVSITDKETGEVKDAIRTVLICKDGTTVAAVSDGIVRDLGKLTAVFGAMPWPEGRTLEVKQISVGKNRTYKLLPVVKAKAKGK